MADPTENTRLTTDPRAAADPLRPADPAHTDEGLVPDSEHPDAQRSANVGGGSTAGAGVAPPRGKGGTSGLVWTGVAVIAILVLLYLLF